MRFFQSPERIENAVIKLTMDGVAYNRLKETIDASKIVINHKVANYDDVELTFEFSIEYYNIVAQLRALSVLLDDTSVSSAMIGSQDALNLLFVDLIDTIRSVQKTLETVETQL